MTKDGRIRWIMETVTSIEYQGKRAILGNSMDITELRETRRQLEESNKRLSQIVEGSSVPTFVIDHQGVVGFQPYEVLEELLKAKKIRKRT